MASAVISGQQSPVSQQPTSSSRRSKPRLPPILPPHSSGFASSTENRAFNRNSHHAQRASNGSVRSGSPAEAGRLRSREQSSHSARAGVASAESTLNPAAMYFSPTGLGGAAGVNSFSTRLGVTDGKGLGVTECLLLHGQLTHVRAVVDVVQLSFSDAMRGYRVYRQDHAVRPILRLLGATDLVLLALAVSFLLSCIASLSDCGTDMGPGSAALRNASDVAALRGQLDDSFSRNLHRVLCFVCVLLVVSRLVSALRRTYMEEVIAIRGMGLQLTEYGVFNQVRRRRFIDLKLIRNLIIHDAFFRYQPIFFLSASVENLPRRVVFFSETLPKLVVLKLVLRGLRHVLYGEEEQGPSLADVEQSRGPRGQQQILSDDDAFTRSDESGLEDFAAGSGEPHSSPQTPTDESEHDSYHPPVRLART